MVHTSCTCVYIHVRVLIIVNVLEYRPGTPTRTTSCPSSSRRAGASTTVLEYVQDPAGSSGGGRCRGGAETRTTGRHCAGSPACRTYSPAHAGTRSCTRVRTRVRTYVQHSVHSVPYGTWLSLATLLLLLIAAHTCMYVCTCSTLVYVRTFYTCTTYSSTCRWSCRASHNVTLKYVRTRCSRTTSCWI